MPLVSCLAWELLGIPPEELAQVAGEREFWVSNQKLKNRTKDEEGQSVHWQKIKWFRYTKDEPKTILFKYKFTASTLRKLTVARQPTRGTRDTKTTHPSTMYESPPGIRASKKKDLQYSPCEPVGVFLTVMQSSITLTVGSE